MDALDTVGWSVFMRYFVVGRLFYKNCRTDLDEKNNQYVTTRLDNVRLMCAILRSFENSTIL